MEKRFNTTPRQGVLGGVQVIEKTTVSVIKCDVGSLAGHHVVPKPLFDVAKKRLTQAQAEGLINSQYVFNAGDDLELLMVHQKGENSHEIHQRAWNIFKEATDLSLIHI